MRAKQSQRPETLAQQAAFLAAFACLGVITEAAAEAGVDRDRHYEWLADAEKWPDYASRYEAAIEQAADRLEAEATRRAVDGWDEPVFGSGGQGVGTVQVGTVRKHSDRMLEILLKARRPERFRERHDLTSGGEKMQAGVIVVPGCAASPQWSETAADQQRKLEQEAADASGRAGE